MKDKGRTKSAEILWKGHVGEHILVVTQGGDREWICNANDSEVTRYANCGENSRHQQTSSGV